MKEKRNTGDTIITIWTALGAVYILGFFVFSMIIGGSAGGGYSEAGKYFVGDHGTYVEVSKTIWQISSVLEILFWIFIFLTPIGALLISNIQEKITTKKNRFE